MAEHIASQKIEVIFNSTPVEFREGATVLEAGGDVRELPSDFVWVFAGGVPPSDFLKAAGVAFGTTELTDKNSNRSLE
jgi:thioredoxin reductase